MGEADTWAKHRATFRSKLRENFSLLILDDGEVFFR